MIVFLSFCFYLFIAITFLALNFYVEHHACVLVVVYTCFYFYCTLCTIEQYNNTQKVPENSENAIILSQVGDAAFWKPRGTDPCTAM